MKSFALTLTAALVALGAHFPLAAQAPAADLQLVQAGPGENARGESPNVQRKMNTAKTRADRKSETKKAITSGDVPSRGEVDPAGAKAQKVTSSRNRLDVKTETRAANKAHQIPSGEK